MASPEWPGTLVASASAPTQRGGRLIELVRRAVRFAFAYAAFEIAMVLVWALLVLAEERRMNSRAIWDTGAFFAVSSAPVAWLPLSLTLYPTLKARISSLIASLLAGTTAASTLALLLAIYSAWLNTISLDTSPPANETFSWMVVAEQFVETLKACAPCGALGGLVFWVVYFWLPTRIGAAEALVQED